MVKCTYHRIYCLLHLLMHNSGILSTFIWLYIHLPYISGTFHLEKVKLYPSNKFLFPFLLASIVIILSFSINWTPLGTSYK